MLWHKLQGAGGAAAPSPFEFVGGYAAAAAASQTPSYSLTSLSGGLSSSPAAGDLIVCAVSFRNTASTDYDIQCTSTGYLGLADLYANDTYDCHLGVYYKISDGTETTVAFDLGVSAASNFCVHVWRGFDPLYVIDTANESAVVDTGVVDPLFVTTKIPGCVVLAIGAGAYDNTTSANISAPSGVSNFFGQGGSNQATIGIYSNFLETASTYNPPAFGRTGSASAQFSNCTFTLAIRPSKTVTSSIPLVGFALNAGVDDPTLVVPDDVQAGDVLLYTDAGEGITEVDPVPSGFTLVSFATRQQIAIKIADGSEGGTTITGGSIGTSDSFQNTLYVFRPAFTVVDFFNSIFSSSGISVTTTLTTPPQLSSTGSIFIYSAQLFSQDIDGNLASVINSTNTVDYTSFSIAEPAAGVSSRINLFQGLTTLTDTQVTQAVSLSSDNGAGSESSQSGYISLLSASDPVPIKYVGGYTESFVGLAADKVISLTSLTGGLASAPAENDIVVVYFGTGSTANRDLVVSGYTEITELYANNTSDTNLVVAYKIMGSTPDTSITLTGGTLSIADAGSVVVHVFRNVDLTTPFDVTTETKTQTNTIIPTPPAITPITNGAVIVSGAAGGHTKNNNRFYSAPYLNAFLSSGGDDTNDSVVGVGFVYWWNTGTFTPSIFTFSDNDSTGGSCASVTLALRPANT